jgi:hypothetical protein
MDPNLSILSREMLVEQTRHIALRWLAGNYGPRGPYTQVVFPPDVAQRIAQIALDQEITHADVVRMLVNLALEHIVL